MINIDLIGGGGKRYFHLLSDATFFRTYRYPDEVAKLACPLQRDVSRKISVSDFIFRFQCGPHMQRERQIMHTYFLTQAENDLDSN